MAFRDLFRLSWVRQEPTKSVPCKGCAGTGLIDLVSGRSVKGPTAEFPVVGANTIDHLNCGGLGTIRVRA